MGTSERIRCLFGTDGVRPSLFGSTTVIDFVFLMNGYKYDRGMPEAIPLKNSPSGIKNILFRGEKLEILTDGKSQTISYTAGKDAKLKTLKATSNKVVKLKL